MFELNENITIKESVVEGSLIYAIDDFYKNPEEILTFLLENETEFHKKEQQPSFNSIHFEDKRHFLQRSEIVKVYEFLSKICKQPPNFENGNDEVITNFFKLKKNKFNDYDNNYWFPHLDSGYTAIIYLNKNDNHSGTNLYKKVNPTEPYPIQSEHYAPWVSKNKFKLIHSLEPKYNRMVLFNGFKFYHGMNICNDDYFGDAYRMNQVLFFQK